MQHSHRSDQLSAGLNELAAVVMLNAVLMLLIDAANVIGSRPTGWWNDRPGAARVFVERVRAAVRTRRLPEPVVIVLEGAFRAGAEAGVTDGITVLHAAGSGDDMLVELSAEATGPVTLVSADRDLRRRAEAHGADLARPGWLIDLLDERGVPGRQPDTEAEKGDLL
jgi:hypothetical protein